MSASANNVETQIDAFLTHVKRTCTKTKEDEERDVKRLPLFKCNSIERSYDGGAIVSVRVEDVLDILECEHALITGGKSLNGCPIITFPDNSSFHNVNETDYQRLITYITSVPSLQEADLGFHLIVDRRKDRWNSVKTILFKISGYFPGIVHNVYVLRPASLLQKAISEVSNKFFKEEFKFHVIICNRVEDLYEYVDRSQLTEDLGGTLRYSHSDWIQQQIELQQFSLLTKEISKALNIYLNDLTETDLPDDQHEHQTYIVERTTLYNELKTQIAQIIRHGQSLMDNIRDHPAVLFAQTTPSDAVDRFDSVFAIKRLLVQMEETERVFDTFWQRHMHLLHYRVEYNKFDAQFNDLRKTFEQHINVATDMYELCETSERIDGCMLQAKQFELQCIDDVERAQTLIARGQQIKDLPQADPNTSAIDAKCAELERIVNLLLDLIAKRMATLNKHRDLMHEVDKANEWCTRGVDLIACQSVDKCLTSAKLAEAALEQIQQFVSEHDIARFKQVVADLTTNETKALIAQVLQRVDDVSLMCEKRMSSLTKTTAAKPVQRVAPAAVSATNASHSANQGGLPLQPVCGAPSLYKTFLKKHPAKDLDSISNISNVSNASSVSDGKVEDVEAKNARRKHTLAELLATEATYVEELGSILKGYKKEMLAEDAAVAGVQFLKQNVHILFGNLDDIHHFHNNTFLKELECNASNSDLIALLFIKWKDTLYQLYSYFCLNSVRSEQLRESMPTESQVIVQELQQKLGHKLPLAAYLLKPIQRITKYQLLLKDLLNASEEAHQTKLREALDCMLVVIACVNYNMQQITIANCPHDIAQQGYLLLQGCFSVSCENKKEKKDLRLRIKQTQRYIFLYEKSMIFCKALNKMHDERDAKSRFQFKSYVKMSQIGLTESVKGDAKKFEVWLEGRQQVYTIQANTLQQKQQWVDKIKRVLFNQLEELKDEKTKQYSNLILKPLRQTYSWERQVTEQDHVSHVASERAMSCDGALHNKSTPDDAIVHAANDSMLYNWYSDCSNSDDEENFVGARELLVATPSKQEKFVILADYNATSDTELNIKEGETCVLLKIGIAGWWYVRVLDRNNEGWVPAAYLERNR